MKATFIFGLSAVMLAGVLPQPVFAQSEQASILDTVDGYAEIVSGFLKEKKAQVEDDIQALKNKESATQQSVTGQQINEAQGGEVVAPTRAKGTPTDTLLRIVKQLYLFLIIVGIYILDHALFRYIALALLILYLLRFVWRMIRG